MLVRVVIVGAVIGLSTCGGGDASQSSGDSVKSLARRDTNPPPTSGAAVAQTPPSDDVRWIDSLVDKSIAFERSPDVTSLAGRGICQTFTRHFLIRTAGENEYVTTLIVRPKTPTSACSADSVAGDYVIHRESEDTPEMRDDWLVVSSGTDIYVTIEIFDVAARAMLQKLVGDVAGWRDSTHLLVWIMGGDVPKSTCPNVSSAFAGVDTLFELDLRANKRVSLGRWRCTPRQ